ncbi:MAG TPA: rhodanese-like domain-containing protein [Gammaproteobacteria bacterium]|nr:rhodanese-like domain-containing protein [Gammaproteobacteria bacterium]
MQQFITFAINHWELFLALAVICALLAYHTFAGFGGAKSVSPQEAIRVINQQQGVVLDVRDPGEVKSGKILDSVTIPLADLPQQLNKLEKYRDRPVIAVCQSGARSARACNILRKHGFDSVYNLQGGILAWTNAGLPLSKKK